VIFDISNTKMYITFLFKELIFVIAIVRIFVIWVGSWCPEANISSDPFSPPEEFGGLVSTSGSSMSLSACCSLMTATSKIAPVDDDDAAIAVDDAVPEAVADVVVVADVRVVYDVGGVDVACTRAGGSVGIDAGGVASGVGAGGGTIPPLFLLLFVIGVFVFVTITIVLFIFVMAPSSSFLHSSSLSSSSCCSFSSDFSFCSSCWSLFISCCSSSWSFLVSFSFLTSSWCRPRPNLFPAQTQHKS
jgi:hypothetical protein